MEQFDPQDLLADEPQDQQDPAMDAAPGEDVPVAQFDGMSVIQLVKRCKEESEEARRERYTLNQINQDAAHCRQDRTAGVRGQSAEFIPKVPMALEQLAAFVKRGLVGFGNYFSVEITPNQSLVGGPLTESGIVKLMRHRLEDPDELPPGALDFPTAVSDGVKVGALEASMIFKIGGTKVDTRRLTVQQNKQSVMIQDPMTGQPHMADMTVSEELVMEEGKVWRLLVELVRPDDYFPDPTGRGLYEVHRTRKDLYQVIEAAEAGEYDLEAVKELVTSYVDAEVDTDMARETDQRQTIRPDFRKEIEIMEFWGTILDSDGNVVHRNCRCAVANNQFLIRRPEPNPYWHQESPFVSTALLRVPFSTFHKALFDYAVRINLSMNELYNLILDGAIGSVWGNKQVKMSRVENSIDFEDGIPQGSTFIISDEHPDGLPVMMNVKSGEVPPEALQVYNLQDREFASATMLSDTARGMTPRKEVSATAVASADQSSSMFFDSVIADLESGIRKVLRLAWLTMLQNCDDWNAEDVAGCIGEQTAKFLAQMSPAKRYKTYAQGARFRVSGLSSMLARTREFQKIMSVNGVLAQSPILSQTFMQEFSPKKMVYQILKAVNIDPDDLKITEEEKASLDQRIAQLPQFGQGGQAQGDQQLQNNPAQQPGSPTQQAQASINQMQQVPQGL